MHKRKRNISDEVKFLPSPKYKKVDLDDKIKPDLTTNTEKNADSTNESITQPVTNLPVKRKKKAGSLAKPKIKMAKAIAGGDVLDEDRDRVEVAQDNKTVKIYLKGDYKNVDHLVANCFEREWDRNQELSSIIERPKHRREATRNYIEIIYKGTNVNKDQIIPFLKKVMNEVENRNIKPSKPELLSKQSNLLKPYPVNGKNLTMILREKPFKEIIKQKEQCAYLRLKEGSDPVLISETIKYRILTTGKQYPYISKVEYSSPDQILVYYHDKYSSKDPINDLYSYLETPAKFYQQSLNQKLIMEPEKNFNLPPQNAGGVSNFFSHQAKPKEKITLEKKSVFAEINQLEERNFNLPPQTAGGVSNFFYNQAKPENDDFAEMYQQMQDWIEDKSNLPENR